MSNRRSSEGYLLIDHRGSPGLPDNFLRDAGLVGPAVVEGRMFEGGTATCKHCGTINILRPERVRPRGYCPKCDGYICDNAACHLECKPFAEILDEAEAKAHREIQHSLGGILIKGT